MNGVSVESLDSGITLLTLTAPGRLNALSRAEALGLANLLRDLGRDPAVRAVILTGAGRGLCACYALEEFAAAVGIARSIVRHTAFGVSLTKRVMRANLDAPSLAHAVLTENHTQVMCTSTAGSSTASLR